MKLVIDEKTEGNIWYRVDFTRYGEVTILARNIKTSRSILGYYYTNYNFRDGYELDDVIGVYRLLDELIEEVKDG